MISSSGTRARLLDQQSFSASTYGTSSSSVSLVGRTNFPLPLIIIIHFFPSMFSADSSGN